MLKPLEASPSKHAGADSRWKPYRWGPTAAGSRSPLRLRRSCGRGLASAPHSWRRPVARIPGRRGWGLQLNPRFPGTVARSSQSRRRSGARIRRRRSRSRQGAVRLRRPDPDPCRSRLPDYRGESAGRPVAGSFHMCGWPGRQLNSSCAAPSPQCGKGPLLPGNLPMRRGEPPEPLHRRAGGLENTHPCFEI